MPDDGSDKDRIILMLLEQNKELMEQLKSLNTEVQLIRESVNKQTVSINQSVEAKSRAVALSQLASNSKEINDPEVKEKCKEVADLVLKYAKAVNYI